MNPVSPVSPARPATVELVVSVSDVHKSYGRVQALRGAQLKVPRGTVFALVGTNGAGKTTLFSILCGFIRADRGAIDVLGGPPGPERLKGRLLALPQDAVLSREMTLREHLSFLAQLQGLAPRQVRSEVERVLELFGLSDLGDRRAGTLSHGQGKRVGVAQAFLGDPELILLDEPTAGLDPRNAHELRQAIVAERGKRTVVVSSHNLQELEAICDEVAFIERGVTIDGGSLAELTNQHREVTVILGRGPVPLPVLAQKLPEVEVSFDEARRALRVRFAAQPDRDSDAAVSQLLRVLLDAGALISEVHKGKSLEQRYLEATTAR